MLDNAIYYCRERVAQPGSDWYYCLRKAPSDKKKLLLALLTLAQEWHDIPIKVHDQDTALAKFSWWQQELQQTFAGQAGHPATQLFLASNGVDYITAAELNAVLIAYQQNLSPVLYQTPQEWQKQPLLRHAMLVLIASKVLSKDVLPESYLTVLTEAVFIVDAISNLRQWLLMGVCPFAISDLAKHNITIQQLQSLQETPEIKSLLKAYAQKALTNFSQLKKDLSKAQIKEQKFLLSYARLQEALLKEITQDNFQVLQHQIMLTPLRKFLLLLY